MYLNNKPILNLAVVGTNLEPKVAKMARKNYALPLNGEREFRFFKSKK